MPTDILISSDPWENRVAILEDGTLSEIYFEREERVIGSIYKGKVQNVLPGMGASFVDIGLGRNAFLYVDDINKTPLNIGDVEITQGRTGWTINEKVNRGDDVLVQIVKEPRGLKGARISTNISLPGRYLILMPTGKYSGVSRKIESADERNRLKNVMKRIRPEGMATVVRTAAAGVSDGELIADLGVLIRMWHGILEQYKHAASPSLLHKDMNLVYKAARDFITPEVKHVYIDDEAEAEKVRDFMRLLGPQYLDRIEHYGKGGDLFHDFKVDEEIQKLLRPKVNLPSGGSIVIETTEALTVIDVNSGKFVGGKNLEDTIVRTNIEAAAEIARQVRLRDIGGIIVCDFIDMSSESSRNRVITTLESGLRRDRTRTTIQSFSPLGLLEFTRKRVGKDLAGQLRGTCPTCTGLGSVMSPESVTISTFRRIRGMSNGVHRPVHVATSPDVAAQMEFWYEDELNALASHIGAAIDVRVDPAVHPERPRLDYGDVAGLAPEAPIRVGDEVEVDLLRSRLPNPTSAAAVVAGRLVEVENAANVAGHTVKIKIMDVDGDDILADLMNPAVSMNGEGRRRRRRGGRARTKPLTQEEQAEELRELAEEAAEGQQNVRTPAIGISTVAEADAEDAVTKDEANVAEDGSVAVAIATDENGVEIRRRRRRRRRRRGGVGGEVAAIGAAPQTLNGPADALADDTADDEGADEEPETAEEGEAVATSAPDENGETRRRRRRRRRRRGGRAQEAAGGEVSENGRPAAAAGVPDRHIFRVNTDGHAEPTGETAPVPPSRELAARARGDVAIEAPAPALTVPGEDVRVTRPSRRRRVTADEPQHGGALAGREEQPALPAPAESSAAAAAPSAAPRRRGRPPRTAAAPYATEPAATEAPTLPRVDEAVARAEAIFEAEATVLATAAAANEAASGTPATPVRRGRRPAVSRTADAAAEPAPRRTRRAAAAEPVIEAVVVVEEAPAAGRRTRKAAEAPAATVRPARTTASSATAARRRPAAEAEPAAKPARRTAAAAAPARKRAAAAAPARKATAARKKATTTAKKSTAKKKR